MKNETLVGAIALLIVLAGLFWYVLGSPAPVSPTPPGPPTSAATSTVPSVGPYTEKTADYTIAANYPTSTPLAGSANDSALAAMRSWVSDAIAGFKQAVTGANMTSASESLQIVYIYGSSQNTVSYIYTIYEDTGGAHGNTLFKTFTFDTRTGALLSLGDVFMPGSNYLAALSQVARARLPGIIGQYADFTAIKDGTTPDEKNFANFFFDGTDFVILFPPYQVAAYAAGPQTLRIPKSQLYSVLKADYH